MVHILLKPGFENFQHYFVSVWDECNCEGAWTFFGIAFLWDWNENWPFPVLRPLLSFPNLLAYSELNGLTKPAWCLSLHSHCWCAWAHLVSQDWMLLTFFFTCSSHCIQLSFCSKKKKKACSCGSPEFSLNGFVQISI